MLRRRLIVYCGLLIAGGVACWFFPLFHIRPLDGQAAETGKRSATSGESEPTNPAAFVNDVWNEPLRTGDTGTEITPLWEAFDRDTSNARKQYGRQAGLGGAWYFCVRGRGTVEAVEKNRAVLSVAKNTRRACLELGAVVDNTVREAIGVEASAFANSQEFNAVSSELNRRVEREVIAPNRALMRPGAIVDFVGCARIDRDSDLDPLCLIPIRVNVLDPAPGDAETGKDPENGTSQ